MLKSIFTIFILFFMTEVFIIGMVATTLVTVALVPEAIKALKTRNTRDISWYWLIIANVGSIFYTIYGVILPSLPIIISSVANVILLSVLLICKIEFH